MAWLLLTFCTSVILFRSFFVFYFFCCCARICYTRQLTCVDIRKFAGYVKTFPKTRFKIQSPSRDADSLLSVYNQFLPFMGPRGLIHVHKNAPLIPFRSHINRLYNLIFCSIDIHFNIILP